MKLHFKCSGRPSETLYPVAKRKSLRPRGLRLAAAPRLI